MGLIQQVRFFKVLAVALGCAAVLASGLPADGADFLARFSNQQGVVISDVAIDAAGNTYLCGSTSNLRAFPGAVRFGAGKDGETGIDAFVVRYSTSGRQSGAVLLCGEGNDTARKVAVSPDGRVVLAGLTDSMSFPMRDAFQPAKAGGADMFIAKFDWAQKELVFCTHLGGSGDEWPTALCVSVDGEIVIVGTTESPDFPRSTPSDGGTGFLHGAFLARVAGDGSRLNWAQHFGGSGRDYIGAMTLDEFGNAFVTGEAVSPDFQTTDFALQPMRMNLDEKSSFYSLEAMFVAGLDTEGQTIFSTFLTGNLPGSDDKAMGIAVDPDGNIVVAGYTTSPVFPALEMEPPECWLPLTNRAFLATLAWDGSSILATNFFEFADYNRFGALAVSPSGVVAGATYIGGVSVLVRLDEDGGRVTGSPNLRCLPSSTVAA